MITLVLKGFVCEICSGLMPLSALKAISSVICSGRRAAELPRDKKRAAAGTVSDLWYGKGKEMAAIMASAGLAWEGFRCVNQNGSYVGIGSGKDTIGVFEMHVLMQDQKRLIFVPPPVHPDLRHIMGDLNDISIFRLTPPKVTGESKDCLAVSSGRWGKGEMRFVIEEESAFESTALKFICLDLCDLGIGEEHLLTAISYRAIHYTGTYHLYSGEEFYPVVCLPHGSSKWLDLGDYITSSV